LTFYHKLRRNHFPPYYSIPGIHTTKETAADDDSNSDVEVRILGLEYSVSTRSVRSTASSASGRSTPAADLEDNDEGVENEDRAWSTDLEDMARAAADDENDEQHENVSGDDLPLESDGEDCDSEVERVSPNAEISIVFRLSNSRTQIHYAKARLINLKRCLEDAIAVADVPGGVHPRMSKALEAAFVPLERLGNDIGYHKRRRTSQRTWKDTNSNTLYLD
jgi:hypothetical protein